jgi:hypothetical protein
LDGSGNLPATVAADRAFPAAVAELGRSAKMIDLTRVHEKEMFHLRSASVLAWSTVEPAMTELGFRLTDDFAERTREDPREKWQSEAVASCNFEREGKDVYPDEEDFDVIRYEILVPWLPEKVIQQSFDALFALAEKLQLPVLYQSKPVSRAECDMMMNRWLSDILAEIGDVAGSESAAILIQMEYERKWSRTRR